MIFPSKTAKKTQDFDGDYHGSEAFELKGSEELAMESGPYIHTYLHTYIHTYIHMYI